MGLSPRASIKRADSFSSCLCSVQAPSELDGAHHLGEGSPLTES